MGSSSSGVPISVDLGKLVSKRKLMIDELSGRTIAIDAYNMLYQFLSIIRQPDGTPLMGPNGEITSHLSGLFYRTVDMVAKGINPIYVFDGIPSHLKQQTTMARIKRREEAHREWEEAKEKGDMETMRTKAQQSTRITKDIVESAQELLTLMGVAHMRAPSEGEAQASWMAKEGIVYAAASQDYDTMLFGAPLVVRNLSFSGRRKLPRKNVYVNVEPEMMALSDTLGALGITREQLVWIGIMIGNDFNRGIDGIGPKTALKIAKESGSIDEMLERVKARGKDFDMDVREVQELFMNPEVKRIDAEDVKQMLGQKCDADAVIGFMCDRHGFMKERMEKSVPVLEKREAQSRQRSIGSWL